MAAHLELLQSLCDRASEWLGQWGAAQVQATSGDSDSPALLSDWFSSKSHSVIDEGRFVAECRLVDARQVRAVGIDLEAAQRPVTARVSSRLATDRERALGLSPLQLWVIKEACFKAARPLEFLTVTDVQLLSWDVERREGRWQGGRFWCSPQEGWLLAVSVLLDECIT